MSSSSVGGRGAATGGSFVDFFLGFEDLEAWLCALLQELFVLLGAGAARQLPPLLPPPAAAFVGPFTAADSKCFALMNCWLAKANKFEQAG